MAVYLSVQTLRDAVERLGVCSAKPSLGDYLIFKRALILTREAQREAGETESDEVVTGIKSTPFVQAINQLTLRSAGAEDLENSTNPYYVPFGSMRDQTHGYRSDKFPSNGSSDTVSRWQSRGSAPLVFVDRTSPKAYKFADRTVADLRTFFIVRNAQEHFSGERPALIDTAVWWYRFSDLEERFGQALDEDDLIRGLIDDLGLTGTEIEALFESPEPSLFELPMENVSQEEP